MSVLDEDPEAIALLERGLDRPWEDHGGQFTVGTALEMDALLAAGIENADAFVAATDGDNTNLVIAQIAKRRFDIDKVVVRVLDPMRAQWYEDQGLSTVCPTQKAIEITDVSVCFAVCMCGARVNNLRPIILLIGPVQLPVF